MFFFLLCQLLSLGEQFPWKKARQMAQDKFSELQKSAPNENRHFCGIWNHDKSFVSTSFTWHGSVQALIIYWCNTGLAVAKSLSRNATCSMLKATRKVFSQNIDINHLLRREFLHKNSSRMEMETSLSSITRKKTCNKIPKKEFYLKPFQLLFDNDESWDFNLQIEFTVKWRNGLFCKKLAALA